MKFNYFLFVLLTLFSRNLYAAGFMPNETVHSGDFTCEIQHLKVGDEATSFDGEKAVTDKVIKNEAKYCNSGIKIIFKDVALTVTPGQLLYLPKINGWVAAKDLKSNDLVLSITGDLISVIGTEQLNKVMRFHDLTIRDQHNFFVSKMGILVHNEPFTFAAFGMTAVAAAAEVAAPYVAKAAVWGAAGYIGCKLSKQSDRPANPIFPAVSGDYTQADKDRIQRAEARESSKKAQAQEKKLEAEKQIRKSKEPTKKAASSKTKLIPAKNSIQKNEAAAIPAEKPAEEKVPKEAGEKPAEEEAPKEVSEDKSKETKGQKLTDDEIKKALEELTGKANPGEKKSAQLSENPDGSISQDFDSVPFDAGVKEKETDKGSIRVGEFSNGWKVIERHSTEGRQTIEIQKPNGRATDKIRYGSK